MYNVFAAEVHHNFYSSYHLVERNKAVMLLACKPAHFESIHLKCCNLFLQVLIVFKNSL